MNITSSLGRQDFFRGSVWLCLNAFLISMVCAAELKTETSSLAAFREVRISTTGDFELVSSSQYGYTITAEPHVASAITFKVSGQKLLIESKKNFETKRPVKIVVRLPMLGKLETLGSADVTSNVPTLPERLELVLDGASDVKMSTVHSRLAIIRLAGSGSLYLTGKADKVALTLTGSADADLRELQSVDAEVTIFGSGDVSLAVSRSLLATISGAGDIGYIGQPKVTTRIDGAGDVQRIR